MLYAGRMSEREKYQAEVAQLVELQPSKLEVAGSRPVFRSKRESNVKGREVHPELAEGRPVFRSEIVKQFRLQGNKGKSKVAEQEKDRLVRAKNNPSASGLREQRSKNLCITVGRLWRSPKRRDFSHVDTFVLLKNW
jgi:hypothetical protein